MNDAMRKRKPIVNIELKIHVIPFILFFEGSDQNSIS
jgi:hypothetical protein